MSNIMQVNGKAAAGLEGLLGSIVAELGGAFELMDWAEDEIQRAARRHPDHRDLLWHSFKLLLPRDIGEGMSTEFVYRSHAAELLERAISGADTRLATAAELCVICAEASQVAPMHSAGAGLYFRLWAQAFPNHPLTAEHAEQQVHYEKLLGAKIDELELGMRGKGIDPSRRLVDIDCKGQHHGEVVACRFAKQKVEVA